MSYKKGAPEGLQSGYSASIIKIAAGRRREASGFSPGALTAILYIFILALLYAALFFCLRYVASLYGCNSEGGINTIGRFAESIWAARRDAMGAQLHQDATREGMQTRTTARCAHCEPGGCRGRFGGGGFKAGERAALPRGQGRGQGRAGGAKGGN